MDTSVEQKIVIKNYLLLCRLRLSIFFRLCVAIFWRFLFFPQGMTPLLLYKVLVIISKNGKIVNRMKGIEQNL